MSRKSKLAFATLNDARKFLEEHGGRMADFKAALKLAGDGMARDMEMIGKKYGSSRISVIFSIFENQCFIYLRLCMVITS